MISDSSSFKIVWAGITCVTLQFYLGIGISILCSGTRKLRGLLLAPGVGLGYLCLWSWWSYRLGFHLDTVNALIMLLPATIVNTFALGRTHFRHSEAAPLFKITLGIATAWAVVFAVSAIPLFERDGCLVASLGNNDFAHHTAIARYLQDSNWKHLSGYVAQDPHHFVWFAENTYFGYYALIALCASIGNNMPHEAVSGVIFATSATMLFPIWLILHERLRLPHLAALFWSTAGVTSTLMLYLSYNGFGAQQLGMLGGLQILYLLWTGSTGSSYSTLFKDCILVSLTLIALLGCYQHMLPFVLVVPFSAMFALTIKRQRMDGVLHLLALLIPPVAFSIVAAWARWRALAAWLVAASNSDSGWPVAFIWPDYLVGLTGPVFSQVHVAATPWPLRFVAIASVLLLGGFGVLFGVARKRWAALAFLFGLAPILVGAAILAKSNGLDGFGGYMSFKLLSFFAPCFTIGLAWVWQMTWRRSTGWRSIAGIYLVAYSGYFVGSIDAIQTALYDRPSLNADAANIMRFPADQQPQSVNIVSDDYWSSMWTTYFLLDTPQFIGIRSYYPATPLNGQITLVQDSRQFFTNKMLEETTAPWSFWRVAKGGCAITSLGIGWHGAEANHIWMGATGNSATLRVRTWGNAQELEINLDLVPFQLDNTYTVLWNGQNVITDCTIPTIRLRIPNPIAGENTLELVSKQPPLPPGGGDSRPVAFGLRHCTTSVLR